MEGSHSVNMMIQLGIVYIQLMQVEHRYQMDRLGVERLRRGRSSLWDRLHTQCYYQIDCMCHLGKVEEVVLDQYKSGQLGS